MNPLPLVTSLALQLHDVRAHKHGLEVLPDRRAGQYGSRDPEGEFSCALQVTQPFHSLQRPLAPVLLAIGGIGGTALDQRQQYVTCQSLKKVLPPEFAARK